MRIEAALEFLDRVCFRGESLKNNNNRSKTMLHYCILKKLTLQSLGEHHFNGILMKFSLSFSLFLCSIRPNDLGFHPFKKGNLKYSSYRRAKAISESRSPDAM